MKKTISRSVYFFIALTLIIVGVIVKYFLVDDNLGARFKNLNHEILSSDIIFFLAIILGLVGLIIYAIKKSKKSRLNDLTIIISAILILPITIVISLTPFLQTLHPGDVGENTFSSIFTYVAIVGTFATFGWIILIIATFIRQVFIILTSDIEQ